jgi:hypothetical protein
VALRGDGMRLIEGSSLSEHELWALARRFLAEHGDEAKVEVTREMHKAYEADDRADYANWLNVSLCLIMLSVPPANRARW